jgi:hypothetical protein
MDQVAFAVEEAVFESALGFNGTSKSVQTRRRHGREQISKDFICFYRGCVAV